MNTKNLHKVVMTLMAFAISILFTQVASAAATHVSQSTGDNGATPTSPSTLTITKPASVASGNLLFAAIAYNGGTDSTVSTPSGWTFIATKDNGTTSGVRTYYKVAGGSEPASYSWTITCGTFTPWASGGIINYSGIKASPLDVSTTNSGVGTSASTNTVTTTAANDLVLHVYSTDADATFSTPTGTTELFDITNPGGVSASISVASEIKATAGTTTARSSTITTGSTVHNWETQTVAFKEADTTPPVFSSVAPANNEYINSIASSSDVDYTISEALASGTITMTWTGGTSDGTPVHTCTLKGTALNSGTHSNFDMSNTTNGCTSAQTLVSGAIYTFAFNGTDLASNSATEVSRTGITYDNTAPGFSDLAPATNAHINSIRTSSAVNYTLSEDLTSATITMSRTGGTWYFPNTHTCTLRGTALNAGVHTALDMSTVTNPANGCTSTQTLTNGSIYSFAFSGTDLAGNASSTTTNSNITYDTTAPTLTSVAPANNAYIRNITTSSPINYTVSEALGSGSITMTRTGGTEDGDSPHVCTLKGTALNSGTHTGLNLSDTANACTSAQTLVDGTVYTFTFNATDEAGNAATTVTRTGLTFDATPPAFSDIAPASDSYIRNISNSSQVNYTLSESLASGSITMTRTGGTADATVHTCTLKGTALNSGTHTGFDLTDTVNGCTVSQSLVDRAAYSFAFSGTDLAGNTGSSTITNVTFDASPYYVTGLTSSKADGTYGLGTLIPIQVVFNEEVKVSGTPQLTIDTGSPSSTVLDYSGGSGSDTLVFNYTVENGNYSSDLEYVNTSSLKLNDGTIEDLAGNGGTISLPSPGNPGSLGDNKDIVIVTGTAPVVMDISSTTPDGYYGETDTIVVTVTFDQPVNVTSRPWINLETGLNDKKATYSGGSGTDTLSFNYTVQSGDSSPDLDYKVPSTINLNGGTIVDSNTGTRNANLTFPNPGAAGSLGANKNIVIDTSTPSTSSVSIASDNVNSSRAKTGDTVTVSITFDEDTQTPEVSIAGTTASVAGGPRSWTASRAMTTDDTEENVSFTINYKDLAGNEGTQVTATSDDSSVTFDKTAPTLLPGTPVPTPTNVSNPDYSFSSDEAGEITYGGDCSSTTGSAAEGNNTVTFKSMDDGTHSNCTITVTDATGNESESLGVEPFRIDTAKPDVTLSTPAPDPTNTSPITFRATFTETVTNFTNENISVENGSVVDFRPDPEANPAGSVYDFDVTPAGEGDVTVGISSSVCQDSAGNNNNAATGITREYDSVRPSVTSLTSTSPESTNTSPIPMSVTFSEPVTGLTSGNISVTNGSASNLDPAFGPATTYTFEVTPDSNDHVTVTVGINADIAQDDAGNGNTASEGSLSRLFNTVQPTLTLSSTVPDGTKTRVASPIGMTATFSDSVTDFTAEDIVVTNATSPVTNFREVSGSVYAFDVAPAEDGLVTINVAAEVARDAAGNPNSEASQYSFTYDTTAPKLREVTKVPTPTMVTAPSYTFSSDEAGSINYSGDCTSPTEMAEAGSNIITFNTLDDGLHDNCSLTVTDDTGNVSESLSISAFYTDGVSPTVTISSTTSDPTNVSPIPMTVTFSEKVKDFDSEDLSISNGSASNFESGENGKTFNFSLVPDADGTVTVDIHAGAATDLSGNENYEANQFSRNVDATAPSITSARMQDYNDDGKVDRIVLNFSEALAAYESGSNGIDVTSESDHGQCNSETIAPDGESTTLNVDFECDRVGTEVGDLTLTLTANPGLSDAIGNQVQSVVLTGQSITDEAMPVVVSTTPANESLNVLVGTDVVVTFSEPMDSRSFDISDSNLEGYASTTWNEAGTVATSSHDNWTSSREITVSVDGSDLAENSVRGTRNYSWSFTTHSASNLGQADLPGEVSVGNSGLDLSNNTSTASGGSIIIDSVLQPLNSVNSGDLVNEDLTLGETVGDVGVLPVKAVTLTSKGTITMSNPAVSNAIVEMPGDTTVLGGTAWDDSLHIQPGSSSGNAPTGFSVGGNVLEVGSPNGVLLLDKLATITMTGVTGPVAYKPSGSTNWFTIPDCGGTYAAPTAPPAPAPYKECSVTDDVNTKILTYHLTSFGPLTTVTSGGGSSGGGSSGGGSSSNSWKYKAPERLITKAKPVLKPAAKPVTKTNLHKAAPILEPSPTTTLIPSCARSSSTKVPFADIKGNFAQSQIEKLYKECAFDGKSPTQFKPNDTLNRAEIAKVLANAFDLGASAYTPTFKDVGEKDWFAKYVLKVAQKGLMRGTIYADSAYFKPYEPITRAEAIGYIFNIKNIKPGNYKSSFLDISPKDWFYNDVAYAQSKGLISGTTAQLGKTGQVKKYYTFKRLLGYTNQGEDVRMLKEIMAQLDYFTGEINDKYDRHLEQAVKAYQKARHIGQSGQMGPITANVLKNEYLVPKTVHYFRPYDLVTRAEFAKMLVTIESHEAK